MSEIKTYIKSSLQLIDGISRGHDSEKLFDEFGIISTNPNDPEENGAATIVLTYGGPTVYLTIGDTIDFHYSFGEETYDETLSNDSVKIEAVRRFAEETSV